MPSWRATASAVMRLSPVAMTMSMPRAFRRPAPAKADALIGSATAIQPASLPSTPPEARSCRRDRSRFGSRPALARVDAEALHEACVAERDGAAPRQCPRTPLPRSASKCSGASSSTPARLGGGDDRLGQRMLARPLEARGERSSVGLVEARERDDVGQRRLALGQRAGLVDDQRIDATRAAPALRRCGSARPRARRGPSPP